MAYKNGLMKAVTFSYDDGILQDIRLIEMLNKYGLKGTFNLNSGLLTSASSWERNGVKVTHVNGTDIKKIYAGHEVAVHTLTHPWLNKLDDETCYNEVATDKAYLEALTGYEVKGSAYPFGAYDEKVIETLNSCGIVYARTAAVTHSFELPAPGTLLALNPTCHHKDAELMKLAREYVELKPTEPTLFYIYGHSYEFDMDDNWDKMEEFCAYISGRDDIWYCTNSEVLIEG